MRKFSFFLKSSLISVFLACFGTFYVSGQGFSSLKIFSHDLKVLKDTDDSGRVCGYHLYIKKNTGVESVMLTETTRDPLGNEPNYAYRAKEWNKYNGDEIRMLNGERLDSKYARYSLVDSTLEDTDFFGKAFHIYVPSELVFGYPWSRSGTVKIGKGTFINIRTFEKKYCDYTGKFYDNPFMFDFVQIEKVVKTEDPADVEVVLTDDYNPQAASDFEEISDFMIYSKGPGTIVEDVMKVIDSISPKDTADIVFAVDATGSMKDDIQELKECLVPRLLEGLKEFKDVRLGLVFYRDYNSNFSTRGLPVKYFEFTDDAKVFTRNLRSLRIAGNEGGDIPEAVYEALYAAMTFYEYRPDAFKKVILIGDAPAHPFPRGTGKYSRQFVLETAKELGIKINAIITPDDKSRRGR